MGFKIIFRSCLGELRTVILKAASNCLEYTYYSIDDGALHCIVFMLPGLFQTISFDNAISLLCVLVYLQLVQLLQLEV